VRRRDAVCNSRSSHTNSCERLNNIIFGTGRRKIKVWLDGTRQKMSFCVIPDTSETGNVHTNMQGVLHKNMSKKTLITFKGQ